MRDLSPEQLDQVELELRAAGARAEDTPWGFANFYRVVYGRPLPDHALREWIEPLYAAREGGKGICIEAFRGSTKTTSVTIAFTAYRIGMEPHKSYLLVQVGDGIAKDTAQMIADLIEHNPGWKRVFPHIVPDRKAGWGAGGYEVVNTDLEYAAWRELCGASKGKDPTLVGLGYKSRAIIGKHPTGCLVVDDIHDENNTRSARELDTVIKILTGTILPTVTPETWKIFIGTPWALNDVLAYVKATGRFVSVQTPVVRENGRMTLRQAQDESDEAVGAQTSASSVEPRAAPNDASIHSVGAQHAAPLRNGFTIAVWPEVFSLAEVEKQRQLTGEVEFARMFLLDIEAASGIHLKRDWLHGYPHEKIDPGWPVVMGVDYASAADQLASARRDYFAVAVGRAIPGGGGVVVVDGYRGKVSQGEAEQRLVALARLYPTLQVIGVEAVGKGEEFYHMLLRTTPLPVMPFHTGRASKGERFEKGMAPLFEFSRAFVSDVITPFLRAFRDEWVGWPHAPHDDTLDAVYWMLRAAEGHLAPGIFSRTARAENPFNALGRR